VNGRLWFSLIIFVASNSYAATYTDDGYCETKEYQELKMCLRHNMKLVDSKIESVTKEYKKVLDKKGLSKLENSRENWESYVSSTCSLHLESSKGGSITPIRSMSCRLNAGEKRLIELGCLLSYHKQDGNEYQKYCKVYFDKQKI